MAEPALCPECTGPQMADHPLGWLMWRHGLDCSLRAHEDSRTLADLDRGEPCFVRPSTATERTLLGALGYFPAADLETLVESATPYLLRRSWPALGEPDTTDGGDAA